ncbi:sorting nexin-21 [Corythoichthys intestinalis]|uniref:sorting nexin-21 n=1 Tax=Corythoichthys intestinalis TaxID=161448 RepID=UPI0025A5345F|nr:sorting nexin-21 [Corythoichthys intestinalis]
MASRLLSRLKRSIFKDGQGAVPEQTGEREDVCEAELEEEDECVTEQLVGTLSFDDGGAAEDGVEEEGSGLDSDSDFLGESLEEEGLCNTGIGVGVGQSESLSFEVTDASVVQDVSSKYVLYTIHVVQAGNSDKTPAVITRRYSDFQRLHATLRHHYRDQMERVCFPRKKLRRNFTAETIAKRSRAFEQYLTHLCSIPDLWGAPSVRFFFYLPDLQTGQLLVSVGRYQDALGPLLNAKRLQDKLGKPLEPLHWLFTLVALCCCFQEVEQLEEARDQCDQALHLLIPSERTHLDRPHPLLPPLLRAVVRLSWQTGQDKRRWEELLHTLEEKGVGQDNQTTMKEFLVKCNLQDNQNDTI